MLYIKGKLGKISIFCQAERSIFWQMIKGVGRVIVSLSSIILFSTRKGQKCINFEIGIQLSLRVN